MAEPEAPEAPKGKQSFLKKKVAGIPMPVILIVGGVAAIYLFKKFKGSSTPSSSSAATPVDTSATPATPVDTSGGLTGGGFTGSGSGLTSDPNAGQTSTPQSPTDTSQFTPPPPASLVTRNGSSLTISQAKARIAITERDIAAARAQLAAAKTPAQRKAALARLASAENALKTQTATLNKLKAA